MNKFIAIFQTIRDRVFRHNEQVLPVNFYTEYLMFNTHYNEFCIGISTLNDLTDKFNILIRCSDSTTDVSFSSYAGKVNRMMGSMSIIRDEYINNNVNKQVECAEKLFLLNIEVCGCLDILKSDIRNVKMHIKTYKSLFKKINKAHMKRFRYSFP